MLHQYKIKFLATIIWLVVLLFLSVSGVFGQDMGNPNQHMNQGMGNPNQDMGNPNQHMNQGMGNPNQDMGNPNQHNPNDPQGFN